MADLKWYELPAVRWQERDSDGIHFWTDSQKQKVYDAENYLRRFLGEDNSRFNSIAEIDQYVTKLLKSAWAIRRWGRPDKVTIVKKSGRNAWGNNGERKK